MATVSTPDFQVVKADLGRAIRRLRRDGQPMETARHLQVAAGVVGSSS